MKVAIKEFYNLFYGNKNKFVRHTIPFVQTSGGKRKPTKCYYAYKNPSNKDEGFAPLTFTEYKNHINGVAGCAVEPLCSDKNIVNGCYYALIDIDCYKPTLAYTVLIKRLLDMGFVFTPVLSKSGGLHLYFMFKDPEPADKAIEALNKIVKLFGLDKVYKNASNKSAVEIFPMHSVEVAGQNGKCVFLPYFDTIHNGQAIGGNGCVITTEGKGLPFKAGIEYFKTNLTTVKQIDKAIDNLPYSDAPYCIQAILLLGMLNENSGRNNFMFSAINYLKKKYGEAFFPKVLEMDKMLLSPIQNEEGGIAELESTFKSVMQKEWHFTCKKEPLCSMCDKTQCKRRVISGVANNNARKNEVTGADSIGKITKYLARVPYYGWEIAPPERTPKEVIFNDIKEITSQTVVQQKCWETLGWAFLPVSNQAWTKIINGAMEGIIDRQVKVDSGSDTSELSEIESSIEKYLIHRSVESGKAYMIKLGQVVEQEKKYLFTTDGLKRHLKTERINVSKYNLREILLSMGCKTEELSLTTSNGIVTTPCWSKPIDEYIEEQKQAYEEAKRLAVEQAKQVLTDTESDDEVEEHIKEDRF